MTTRTVAPALGFGPGNRTSRVSAGDAGHPHDGGARCIVRQRERMTTGSTKPRFTGLTLRRMTA
ncbi:hypothetical protein [Burkholderia lata]|uniref:hypothetical protein n=1 Tax=Burkholderia lata (strain ATCC 17760 / DSM 23089 / LMG 22485 / NCIMB 9086 / R18194 / 383) TaxID=482957 RepID=UPI0002EAB7A2|nr:hypothetical protein [Burkholderia lata]